MFRDEQAETLRNIIERAEILALQEVGTTLTDKNSKEYTFFRDNILKFLPGRKLHAIDNFAFVYDSNKFSIVSCKTVLFKAAVNCSFQVGKEKQAKNMKYFFYDCFGFLAE